MPTPTPYASFVQAVTGAKAQTFPYEGSTIAAQTLTLGTLFVAGIALGGDVQVDGGLVEITTAVTTPSHTWMVLLQAIAMGGLPAMTVLAVTADQLAGAVGLGIYQLAFTAPYVTPGDGGLYYLGIMSAGATAGAAMGVTTTASSGFTPGLAGTAGTALTVPPAVGTATAAFTAGTVSLWAEAV
jgi:hypothetical protein